MSIKYKSVFKSRRAYLLLDRRSELSMNNRIFDQYGREAANEGCKASVTSK